MKITNFLKRWKQGIMSSTASQQLKAKVIGLVGTIVGLIIGGIVLISKGYWTFSIFILFMTYLQGVELVGTIKQLESIRQFEYVELPGGRNENSKTNR